MNVTSKTYLNELVKGFKNEGPPCLFNDFLFLFYRKFFLSEMAVSPKYFTQESYKITFYSLHT